jgi:hypothetical protein
MSEGIFRDALMIIAAMMLFGCLLAGLAKHGLTVPEGQAAFAILNNKKVDYFLLISGFAIIIWQNYRFSYLRKQCSESNKNDKD